MKEITALGISSEKVKRTRDMLAGKKVSGFEKYFVCEGLWAVEKLIAKKINVTEFFFCPEMIKTDAEAELVEEMKAYAANVYSVSQKTCTKISDREGADGFFIVAEMPDYSLDDMNKSLEENQNLTCIILDGLEQPGNIGAILRSLNCAGGAFAIVTNKRVRFTHPRLIRSSLGAAFTLPVVNADISEAQKWLAEKDFKILVTDLTATKNYREIDYNGRIAIVAGNEFKGISPSWRTADNAEPIIIPMFGDLESLNVGFASTLVAYEAGMKQRGM